jgi:hypothetical protein
MQEVDDGTLCHKGGENLLLNFTFSKISKYVQNAFQLIRYTKACRAFD